MKFFTDYNLSKLRGVDYAYEYELDREFEGSNVDADAKDWMNENNENEVHAQMCIDCDDK